MQDFEKTLFQSSEYEKRVLSLFKSACHDLIGADSFDVHLLEEFTRSNKDGEATLDKIYDYVRNTDAFAARHRDLIRSVAFLEATSDATDKCDESSISEDEVEAYLTRFRTVPGYSVESLKRDIRTSISQTGAFFASTTSGENTHAHDNALEEFGRACGTSASSPPCQVDDDDSTTAVIRASDDQRRQPKRTPAQARQETVDVKTMLSEFHEEYGRPMYVQEYIRYMSLDRSPDRALFQDERPALHALINVISDVYVQYLGVNVLEYDIIDRYLPLFSKEAFESSAATEQVFHKVTHEVIQTDQYEVAMSKKISDDYASMFSVDISAIDTRCVFLTARAQVVSLTDDRLRECIMEFKNQTDMIVNNLYDVYMAVYERTPDAEELVEHVQSYRANEPTETRMPVLNRGVECRLVSSLEFQDVLKARIKQRHIEVNQDSMTTTAMYTTLEKGLERLRALPLEQRTLAQVDSIVSDLVA
jgi:hypothetical protein